MVFPLGGWHFCTLATIDLRALFGVNSVCVFSVIGNGALVLPKPSHRVRQLLGVREHFFAHEGEVTARTGV